MVYLCTAISVFVSCCSVTAAARGISAGHKFYYQDETNKVTGSLAKHLSSLISEKGSMDAFYIMFGHPYDGDANMIQSHSYSYLSSMLKGMEYAVKGCTVNTDLGPVDQYKYRKKRSKEVKLSEEQKEMVEQRVMQEGEVLAPTQRAPDAFQRARVFQQIADDLQLEGIGAADVKAHLEKMVLDDKNLAMDANVKDTLKTYYKSADWLHDYGEKSGLKFEDPSGLESKDFQKLGMIAHSWNDCIPGSFICLHVLQIRNYGPYFGNNVTVTEMKPVLAWLVRKAKNYPSTPVITLLQEFNNHLYDVSREVLGELSQHCANIQLLAFTLARNEETDSVNHNFCPTHSPPIACINFGQLNPREYLLVRLENEAERPKAIYKIHVNDDRNSIATLINVHSRDCM